ncbi:MAG: hypothetical protein LBH32_04875 [Dysgonamonadaceae bacterium]|jgi:hypothetical protein|nr:hypothetical protein [Dysgonamonadaceae bacterium]
MSEKIKPIELIHFIFDKNITSVSMNDTDFTKDKYTVSLKRNEYNDYATHLEIDEIKEDGKLVMLYQIHFYEAMDISITDDTIVFLVQSSDGFGPDSKITITYN